jgi:hypothetical protein
VECVRGSLSDILAYDQITAKGEFVIGSMPPSAMLKNFLILMPDLLIETHPELSAKILAEQVALRWGIPKRTAYNYYSGAVTNEPSVALPIRRHSGRFFDLGLKLQQIWQWRWDAPP